MATTTKPAFLNPTSVEPADPPENESGASSPRKGGSVLRWILLTVGVLTLLAAIVGGIYLVRRHQRATGAGASALLKKSSSEKSKTSMPPTVIDLPLEPFVVNLAAAGGHGFARIGLTLHLATPAGTKKKASGEKDATADDLRDMVRDQIINVLNRQQSADLLAPNGKERLKRAIEAGITAKNPQLQVVDIYFTEFLVQS